MKILAIVLAYCSILMTATGGLYVSFIQDGADVVVNASGSVDVTGATFAGQVAVSWHKAEGGSIDILWNITADDDYYRISNVDSIFTESFSVNATSFSGDTFGLYANGLNDLYFYVPDGFTSGTLSGSLTFSNRLLQDFGVIEQTVFWGSSPDRSITVVPEPASAGLLALVSGGIYFVRRFFIA